MQVPGFETGMGVFEVTSIMWMVDLLMIIYFWNNWLYHYQKDIDQALHILMMEMNLPRLPAISIRQNKNHRPSTREASHCRRNVASVYLGDLFCADFPLLINTLNIANVALIGASILFCDQNH